MTKTKRQKPPAPEQFIIHLVDKEGTPIAMLKGHIDGIRETTKQGVPIHHYTVDMIALGGLPWDHISPTYRTRILEICNKIAPSLALKDYIEGPPPPPDSDRTPA